MFARWGAAHHSISFAPPAILVDAKLSLAVVVLVVSAGRFVVRVVVVVRLGNCLHLLGWGGCR